MRVLFHIFVILGCVFLVLIILFAAVYRDRRPPIYFAAESGDTNGIARYLTLGSNVNALINCYPFSERVQRAPLLDVAIGKGEVGCVDFLLQHGASPNQQDSHGETPLMWVIGRTPGQTGLKMFRMLLSAGADPNLRSSGEFWTPLIYAADLGQTQFVSCLLDAGAEIRATNNQGLTALHYAQNGEIVRLLIAAGADPKDRIGGETPAETATRLCHFSALAVLTNAPTKTNN
jgi:ankyrin repeat protein